MTQSVNNAISKLFFKSKVNSSVRKIYILSYKFKKLLALLPTREVEFCDTSTNTIAIIQFSKILFVIFKKYILLHNFLPVQYCLVTICFGALSWCTGHTASLKCSI